MNTDLEHTSTAGISPDFTDPVKANPAGGQLFRPSPGDATGKPPAAESSLKKDGVALKDKAMTRLASEADVRKDIVSDQLKIVSSALGAAEDELSKKDSDATEWLKSGLHQVVTTVEQLADRVQNKDSAELIGEVRSFAQDNPKTFLAACAAVGFAAARVLKAGGSEDSPLDKSEGATAFGGPS